MLFYSIVERSTFSNIPGWVQYVQKVIYMYVTYMYMLLITVVV